MAREDRGHGPRGRFGGRHEARFRNRQSEASREPREAWERGGRSGDDPPRPRRDDRAGAWPESFGMHEAYRGYHSGLPERRATRERRFGGRGPKGYRRSDDRIREDVCDELMRSEDVDATDITVAVRDGEVTLDGTVHDRGMKRDAESCADAVLGVRDVHNRLQLRPPSAETRAQ